MMFVDQFHDPMLAVLANLVASRPKVAAAVADYDIKPEEVGGLPDNAFAWCEKRAFPVHSREHTILSRVYRANVPNVPPHVDDAIKEACDIYGIPDELFEQEKTAAVTENLDDYLLPSLKRLPVRSAEQVKTAETALLDNYKKLSLEHRAEACKRLIDKAAAYNVRLNPLMHKLAGFTVTSTRQLSDWIEARTMAAPDIYKAAFQKLANVVKELPAEINNRDQQIKLAETIGALDEKAGLVKYYDRKLPDALQTVFNTEKIAGHGVDLNGHFVPLAKLALYPSTFYGDILGDDLVREASDGRGGMDPQKLAAILQTLPRDMKNLLASHIR
jgi:hypothetical protein